MRCARHWTGQRPRPPPGTLPTLPRPALHLARCHRWLLPGPHRASCRHSLRSACCEPGGALGAAVVPCGRGSGSGSVAVGDGPGGSRGARPPGPCARTLPGPRPPGRCSSLTSGRKPDEWWGPLPTPIPSLVLIKQMHQMHQKSIRKACKRRAKKSRYSAP